MSEQAFVFPSSFAQQRLWLLDQLVPHNPFYNIFSALPLRLHSVSSLERAFNEMVRRHEVLRTTFTAVDGHPMQVVAPSLTIAMPMIDLRGDPPDGRQAEIERLARDEAQRPFDLANGPLLRTVLVCLKDADFVLLLTMHHIVSDGWSMGIFFNELTTLYLSFASGRRAELPELPIQYADFAAWQREWLNGEVLEQQLAFWQQQLQDAPPLRLPLDRARPTVKTYRGARLAIEVPAGLTEKLRGLSRSEGCTLFMTLLAAFQLLLCRYTNQEDVIVGSPIAGRNRAEVEGLIGFFVNTVVMRTDLSGDPSFRALLQRVRDVATNAYAHQDLPFEMVVESVLHERDLARNPLFQVIFQLLNAPTVANGAATADAPVSGLQRIYSETAKFDLEFSLFESAEGLTGFLEYSTDVFEEPSMQRMANHFRALLEGIVADPDERISRYRLSTPAEREQLATQWNSTATEYPREHCVHRLVELQAARRPDAVVVVHEQRHVTYRELNARANALARRIVAAGVGPRALVGVCMERSAGMVVALLAVLKAGGAYVPIDPDYPRPRIQFMLSDAGARVVLTEPRFVDRLAGAGEVICLDADAQMDFANVEIPVVAADLAYVMYTSGSTGVPKGVCISHRAVCRLVLNTNYIELDPSDRVAFASNTSFDAATFEIWGPLLSGAAIVVIDKDVLLSPQDFTTHIRAQGVTTLFLTTALFNKIAAENAAAFASLRCLMFGGSAVDPKWVRAVLHDGPPGRLLHVYGPTESTTFAAWHEVTDVPEGASTVSIGMPLANTRLHVLDQYGEPVPVGVPGELHVGGDGLARGYHNRPSLTAEKFVPDPFSGSPGERLYRTGDLVRRRPDGDIEFVGRIDNQIKIRGFRVELDEIQAALNEHPAVQDSVVVAREDAHGDRRLAAYVVPRSGSEDGDGAIAEEYVSHWQRVFENHVYGEFADQTDPTFNITGWNSTLTGLPIPEAEMREWTKDTVGEILQLKPRRVLEIGCGTGLLLFRVAPVCHTYWASDFSPTALDYVHRVMAIPGRALPMVKLMQREAHDFADIEPGSFDLVILNSVIQYFPDRDYLQQVLEGAVRAVRSGGHIYLGDVRSLPLLKALHASVQLHKAEPALGIDRLRERIETEIVRETELAVRPSFFTSLTERLAPIARADVWPKQSGADNELGKFRYQVLLSLGSQPRDPVRPEWIDWETKRWDADEIRAFLERERPAAMGFAAVANARVSFENRLLHALGGTDVARSVADLRAELASSASSGIEPQTLQELAGVLPYEVHVSCARQDDEGRYDVAFVRRAAPAFESTRRRDTEFPVKAVAASATAQSEVTNNPLRRETHRQLGPQLRNYLQERLPDFMVPAGFVTLSSLPLTPNGKIDYKALPAPDGIRPELEEAFVDARDEIESILVRVWCNVLAIDRVGVNDNFFELGGDSILSIQIIARAKQAGLQLTPQQIFQHQTIAELAPFAKKLTESGAEQDIVLGSAPLTPVQAWFVEQELEEPHHFNQSVLLAVDRATDAEIVRRSVRELLLHHDALRLRLTRSADGWLLSHAEPDNEIPFEEHDLAGAAPGDHAAALERELARVQASISLERGPLMRVALFRLGGQSGHRLFIVIHHFAVDGVSWRVLLEDFQACYAQIVRGEAVSLPPKTTSFRRWARRLEQYASSATLQQELSFWLQGPVSTASLPVDHDSGANTVAAAHNIDTMLSAADTEAILKEVPTVQRCQINEILLSALARAIAGWTGSPYLLLDLEGHGREDLFEGADLSRTVGWFTSIFPVWLVHKIGLSAAETLRATKEQLRRIPNRGIGYGVLRYLSSDAKIREHLRSQPQAQLSFNYLGQFGSANGQGEALPSATEAKGPDRSPRGRRHHLIEINAHVERGLLRVRWTYSANHHRRETISALADAYVDSLRKLVNESRATGQLDYAPIDFPNLKLSQKELDAVLAELTGDREAR